MSNETQSPARQRIETLLDANSFVEIGARVTARSTDFNLSEKLSLIHISKAAEFLAITQTTSYSFWDLEQKSVFDCNNHNAFLSMMAVSYTHLDVYKRQFPGRGTILAS